MNKHRILTLAFALLTFAAAPSIMADAGIFRNEIVESADQPLQISVGEHRFVRIVNFVQEGGTDRGLISVTRPNGKASFVMSANFASESEVQKDFIVAGPATITVNPTANGKLFLTYRISKNN